MASPAITDLEIQEPNYLAAKTRFSGIFSWILSTDHKRIGLLYLGSLIIFFLVGVVLGFFMRLEQLTIGHTVVSAQVYNTLFTVHGVIMIFLVVIPGVPATLGNFVLPLQLGAKDVAFPRLNLLSWWLYAIGALIILSSLFTGGGLPDTGWTFYAPYNVRTTTNVPLAVTGVFIIGFSSILTGLNFITTMHQLRAPGMSWFRMPLFCWGLYATGWIQILATPVLGITMLLVFAENVLNIGVFDPAIGGDPILYQHLFWIYSHPAVYVMILPAMGVISEIMPTFSRRTIFGYKAIAYSSLAIALAGSLVWGHHMFTSGQSYTANVVFSLLTFLVGIPTAIKVFNWVATLYKGSIRVEPPFLYALMFIFLFSIGGFSGLMQGTLNVDVHLHDTYWVVSHFHYVMFGGTVMGLFAGIHYWFPKMSGRMYNKKQANVALAIIFVGFNMLYFTMMTMGYEGMPRRYYDHLEQFHGSHVFATVGSWVLIAGLILMFVNLWQGLKRGEEASQNPWGGTTLEWTHVPAMPPPENYDEIPSVDREPYDHGNPEVAK
ncbi:MAG: cytochrome c oxidase subunit I [Calditrichae bacterium]|nr:cytochrome c oxidase subunit I [Calditrichia bacterium]